jgi:hypothetical protein
MIRIDDFQRRTSYRCRNTRFFEDVPLPRELVNDRHAGRSKQLTAQ